MQTVPYRYVKVQSLDSVGVGSLNNYRAQKAAAFKRLQSLKRMRANLHPMERTRMALQILGAESSWKECVRNEASCLRFLEEEANKQGLTILTEKQRQKRDDEAAHLLKVRNELRAQMGQEPIVA